MDTKKLKHKDIYTKEMGDPPENNDMGSATKPPKQDMGAGAGRGKQGGPTAKELADYSRKQNQKKLDDMGPALTKGGSVSAPSRGTGMHKMPNGKMMKNSDMMKHGGAAMKMTTKKVRRFAEGGSEASGDYGGGGGDFGDAGSYADPSNVGRNVDPNAGELSGRDPPTLSAFDSGRNANLAAISNQASPALASRAHNSGLGAAPTNWGRVSIAPEAAAPTNAPSGFFGRTSIAPEASKAADAAHMQTMQDLANARTSMAPEAVAPTNAPVGAYGKTSIASQLSAEDIAHEQEMQAIANAISAGASRADAIAAGAAARGQLGTRGAGTEDSGQFTGGNINDNAKGGMIKKYAKGFTVKKYAKGGMVSSASSRGDGIAVRGKTKGKLY